MAHGFAVRERRFFFMFHDKDFEYFEKMAHWSFDEYDCHTESLTDWDLYEILKSVATPDSHVLDLGTGGGEKLLANFPDCAEIIGTDYSPNMVETARENLAKSGRKNISFKVMDNLNMDVPSGHFDIVVARHTIIDAEQVYKCLKPGGLLLIRGVDKYDCWDLKLTVGYGQGFDDPVPVSIVDYENVLNAGFHDVELVPIHEREFYKDVKTFKAFLEVVPILDEMPDDALLDEYIAKNTYAGRVRLIRRCYGLTARKPD